MFAKRLKAGGCTLTLQVSDLRRNAPDLGDAPCLVKCSLVNGGRMDVGNGFDSGKLPGEKTHPYVRAFFSGLECAVCADYCLELVITEL